MSSSVGVTIPNIWKNKIHVPNHQPEYAASCSTLSFDHGKVPVDMGSKNLLWPTTFGFVRNGHQMVLIISLMQTYHLGMVIPPIKMVMTWEWFIVVFTTVDHIFRHTQI